MELGCTHSEIVLGVDVFFFYVSLSTRALGHAGTPPSEHGVIVMPAGISNKLLLIIVRTKSGRLRISAKSKLQNRHPRIAKLLADGLHYRRDHAQVLGDNRQRPKGIR